MRVSEKRMHMGEAYYQRWTYLSVGGIHLRDELELRLWVNEDWSRGEAAFKFQEGCLHLRSSME